MNVRRRQSLPLDSIPNNNKQLRLTESPLVPYPAVHPLQLLPPDAASALGLGLKLLPTHNGTRDEPLSMQIAFTTSSSGCEAALMNGRHEAWLDRESDRNKLLRMSRLTDNAC